MDAGALTTVGVFIAAQTGSLIFFGGIVAATLRQHDRRLDKVENKCDGCSKVVAQIQVKEGL